MIATIPFIIFFLNNCWYFANYVDFDKVRNTLIFIHGGGYCMGSTMGYDNVLFKIAKQTDYVVIGIDYPLSPVVKFPEHRLQCEEAIAFLHQHSKRFVLFYFTPGKF